MAKVKDMAKELVDTQVGDNGEVKEPTFQEELESIVAQYNDAIKQRDQFSNLATRCLGSIEVLEKIVKKEEDASVRKD